MVVRIWSREVMACFQVLSTYSLGESEERLTSGQVVTQLRFDQRTCGLQEYNGYRSANRLVISSMVQ
jgi:hypothetical protein